MLLCTINVFRPMDLALIDISFSDECNLFGLSVGVLAWCYGRELLARPVSELLTPLI